MKGWLEMTVSGIRQWTDSHISLRLRGADLDFRAGQFVRVGIVEEESVLARPYSLVNTPQEEELEVFFNVVPDGPLSPRLAELKIGDSVRVAEKANGFLIVDEVPECRDLWMLATGTGVGPFLSILRTDQPWQRFESVTLVYSVKTADELAYRDVIDTVSSGHDNFSFVPVITREEVQDAIGVRITDALENGELESRTGHRITAQDSHVMMCGNSEMIREVFVQLEARGMKKHLRREAGHITTEKYH